MRELVYGVAFACLMGPVLAQTLAPLVRPFHVGRPSAFDTARRRLVMIGDDGSTWELAGGELLQRVNATGAPTPTPRYGHAMCYDELRRRVLMFGGADATGNRNDTWVYDGANWTQLTGGPTPPARRLAAMAWDSTRDRVVMWGSVLGGLQDTWEHDGTAWLQRTPTTWPTGQYNPGPMAFDRQRGVMVMVIASFQFPFPVPARTWEWDGVNWALRSTIGPVFGGAATLTFDIARNRTVLAGGVDNERIWEWDGTSWTAATLPQPFRRMEPASWFDPICGCTTIVGGTEWLPPGTGPARVDQWQWNGQTLTQVQTDSIGPPGSRGMLFSDPLRRRVLHFGGQRPDNSLSDATWSLAAGVWTELSSPTRPPARQLAASAHDLILGESLLFGGEANGTVLGDTWSIADAGWVARSGTGPAPRAEAAMAADLQRGVIVLFGGTVGVPGGVLDDTWEWNGMQWLQRPTTVRPSPRKGAAMAFHPQLGKMLLFGATDNPPRNDTWTWDGSQWTQLAPATVPAPLAPLAMGSDLVNRHCILVGTDFYAVGGPVQQAWRHNGTDWLPLLNEPPPRLGNWSPCATSASFDTMTCVHSRSPGAVADLTITPGRVAAIGAGCGTPASTLVVRSRPRPGATTGLELVANPSRVVQFAVDLSSGNTPLGAGCTLWLATGFASAFQVSSSSGFAEQSWLLPANSGLRGLELFAQAAVLEPLSSNGLVLTQGLRLTVGD